jgi:hypothetical protein
MVIAIGVVAVFAVYINNRLAIRRLNRADRMGLELYERKARCEGTFPFDYLSR